MESFRDVLADIARLPSMYVGALSLKDVSNYLYGYDHATMNFAKGLPEDRPLYGWMQWIELRFMIAHPAWGWPRILLHVYGSDRAALDALPTLYDQFVEQRSAIGVPGINAELNRKLMEEYGSDWHIPESTHTTEPCRSG